MAEPLVVLDGREFVADRQTGIGRFLLALVDAVRRRSPGWRLQIVSPRGFAPPDGVDTRTVGAADGRAWDLIDGERASSATRWRGWRAWENGRRRTPWWRC